MLGLYYQPVLYLAHETGLGMEGASKGLLACIEEGFCAYDEASEFVFVFEMAKWQIAEVLKPSDKRCAGIQKDYESLPGNPFLGAFYDRYAKAFNLRTRRGDKQGASQGPSKGLRSQEQEQEQKQEQEQEHSFAGGACAPPVAATKPDAAPPAERKPKAAAPKPPAPSTAVWDAYAAEYRNRYATDPVRNAKVNGQLSQLIARLGQDEAPGVARFYVRSDDQFYVRQMHAVDYLLRDAEKLRTQWATGRTVPQAVGAGRIRAGPLTDAEREAANAAATAEAKRLYLAKRAGGDVIDGAVTVIDNPAPTLELQ